MSLFKNRRDMPITRRSFLTTASMLAAGNVLGFRPFGMLNALAGTSSNYKALVRVFMFGGNDANNMLIPNDSAGYNNYASIRGALALPQNSLLPLGTGGQFALHPSMSEVQVLLTIRTQPCLPMWVRCLPRRPKLLTRRQASRCRAISSPILTSNPNGRTKCRTPVEHRAGLGVLPSCCNRS